MQWVVMRPSNLGAMAKEKLIRFITSAARRHCPAANGIHELFITIQACQQAGQFN
jgi:hypothetical protein